MDASEGEEQGVEDQRDTKSPIHHLQQIWRERHGVLVPIALAALLFLFELYSNSISSLISKNVDTDNVPKWFESGLLKSDELRVQYKHFVETIARIASPILLGAFVLFSAGVSIAETKRRATIEKLTDEIHFARDDASATLELARANLQKAEAERDNAIGKAEEHRTKIADIKNHIDLGASYKEVIRIGVFARLLAYAPLYVAQYLKFFEDEGLEVEVKVAGGDEQVAAGLRTGQYDFGICDPVFVLEDKAKSTERLKIVTPIAKRLDVTVVCRRDVLENKEREPVTIAAFKRPSTTYACALKLKEDLDKLGLFKSIEIVELSSDDDRFLEPTPLAELLGKYDFVLLWNPATSWLYEGQVPGAEQFGRLACLRRPGSPVQSEHWRVKGFGKDEAIDLALEYLWNPNNAQGDGHKLLASALLTSEFMETHRRELCRKMFRAVSRALVRIEGANWELEKKTPYKLRKMIQDIMDNGDYLTDATLQRLISDPEASSLSVFPFIQGIYVYKQNDYARHLKNLRSLWANDPDSKSRFQMFKAPKDYLAFFASVRD